MNLAGVLNDNNVAIDWHPNGQEIAVGLNTGKVVVRNIIDKNKNTEKILGRSSNIINLGDAITAIAYSPDGKKIFAAQQLPAKITVWDVESCEDEDFFFNGFSAQQLHMNSDGKSVICLSNHNLLQHLFELDISPHKKMKRYTSDKKKISREANIDPLKCHIVMQTLSRLRDKKKRVRDLNPEAMQDTRNKFTQLKELGFDDKEAEKMILEDKDLLLADEAYDYYLLLKEQLGDAFANMKIGQKGKDICLDDFLKHQPVDDQNQICNQIDMIQLPNAQSNEDVCTIV